MKIFIAGPRAITTLPEPVQNRLKNLSEKNHTVLVGDANGVDKAVQKYFAAHDYANVIVYASSGKARNNIGDWPVEAVPVPDGVKGFDYYAAKDKAMAAAADYGFMIWNGESKGTLNNIINLLADEKTALVYFAPQQVFATIDSHEKLEELLSRCSDEAKNLYERLRPAPIQLTLNEAPN